MIERLKWNDAAKELPGPGNTVLLWVRDPKPFANPGWMTGYHDDGEWHDSETSHVLTEIVTHWADPEWPSRLTLAACEYLITIIDRDAPLLAGMMEYKAARAAIAKATGSAE